MLKCSHPLGVAIALAGVVSLSTAFAAERRADCPPGLHGIAVGVFMRGTLGTPFHQLLRIRDGGVAGSEAHDPANGITD